MKVLTKCLSIFSLLISLLLVRRTESFLDRVRRFGPAYLSKSGLGYLVALAFPIDLSDRDVFISFNFEANYGVPHNDSILSNGIFQKWGFHLKRDVEYQEHKESVNIERRFDQIYTRAKFYHIIEAQLYQSGFNGTECLLRTICETAKADIHYHNGVLGDLFHILFSPSSSREEDLPPIIYEAEEQGYIGSCRAFKKYCPKSLLSFISKWY